MEEASLPSKVPRTGIGPWMAVAVALLAGNCLLLVAPPGLIRAIAALVILVLPGLVLAELLLSRRSPVLRWTVGVGLGYALIIIAGLAFAYLPGPISRWGVLALADCLTLGLVVPLFRSPRRATSGGSRIWPVLLVLALLIAGTFRFASLGYSEFQGDEVKAMLPAARVLGGHPDALTQGRKKGPAEIVLPMLSWRLTETTDEASSRLPFALAGVGTIATLFLLGRRLGGNQAGLAVAGVAALNGLLIAFSRIVQYQAIVLWMSALAVLCAWEWYERDETLWALLSGVFMGVGLLAHYDALAVLPVLAYIALRSILRKNTPSQRRAWCRDVLLSLLLMALIAGVFYGPYLFSSQMGATESYLGERVGGLSLKNRTENFLTYGIFYSSFLYLVLTGALVLVYIAWQVYRGPAVWRVRGARYWVPAVMVLGAVVLMVWPAALRFGALDLSPLVWLLILLAAVLLSSPSAAVQGTLIWLVVTFVEYNFLLADPRTHIYGIFLPWSLLAGAALAAIWGAWTRVGPRWVGIALAGALVICFGPFLFNSYLRHDGAGSQERPAIEQALAWAPAPYAEPPTQGVFGRVHRSGWKGIGVLYAEGKLSGDIDSNEKSELTDWYVPSAYRVSEPDPCSRLPRYLLVADDLVATSGMWAGGPSNLSQFSEIGRVELPNGKGVTIYEVGTGSSTIGRVDAREFTRRFDQMASPEWFAEGSRPTRELLADLGGLIQLTGYDAWQVGDSIAVTLFWRALQTPRDDYQVFVHIEGGLTGTGPAGVWGQSDGTPACGQSPTGSWTSGDGVVDRRVVTPAPEAQPGSYSLIAGLYRLDTGQRLPVLDAEGQPVGDSVVLEQVVLPLR
jgi:hypothetical protein